MRLRDDLIEVDALGCILCGEIIWSCHRHDMQYCGCGAIAVDGGRDYMKISYDGDVETPIYTHEMITMPKVRFYKTNNTRNWRTY